jgi:hypothetical protein
MKTKQRKNFFFGIIVLMLFSFQTYGQDAWTLHSEVSGVQAYYQITSCQTESVVCIKFINANSYAVNISWDEQMTFEGSSVAQTVNPMAINLLVPSGEMAGSTCTETPILQLVSRPNIMLASIPSEGDLPLLDDTNNQEVLDKVVTAFNFLNLQVSQE